MKPDSSRSDSLAARAWDGTQGGEPEPVSVKVSGDLDLHTYRPRDLPELLPAWFEECQAQGILTVRVIHGKGTGSLREAAHKLLAKISAGPGTMISGWSYPAPEMAGGWGATLVRLFASSVRN